MYVRLIAEEALFRCVHACAAPPLPCSCDNITIAPPLLKELEASKAPLPYQLWPTMVSRGAGWDPGTRESGPGLPTTSIAPLEGCR